VKRRRFVASGSATLAAGLAALRPAAAAFPKASLRERLSTRAETSNYTQTSTYADVGRILTELDLRGAPIFRGSLGRSEGGREIPFVIASRPRVTSIAEARALNRPIVYIQAALHGNEVDGKEAMLAILRDLCLSTEKTLLDDLVLAIVPIANPDGHERYGQQTRNAPEQNGPARIGIRENAQGYDLDRDFIKLETPEVRAIMEFVNAWNPNVFVDLRTEGGSFSDFSITHAPSLHPAAYFGGLFARDRLLPAVHGELHDKFGVETFASGHFGRYKPMPAPPAPNDWVNFGWFAPDYRARHGVNYMGVRGAVAVLAQSYAHDTLERRVFTTRAFVESLLGYCSENDDEVMNNLKTMTHWLGGPIPIRASYPLRPPAQVISWENLALNSDLEADPEPGIPAGLKRTDTFSSASMPIFDRYVPALTMTQTKGYLIPSQYVEHVKRLLERHGIAHTVLTDSESLMVEEFGVERVDREPAATDGHRPIALSGRWYGPTAFTAASGSVMVPCVQALGPLISVLLEPESDDSFFTWNAFEGYTTPGFVVPVFRVI
jgi:Zinc carboxypeptidase